MGWQVVVDELTELGQRLARARTIRLAPRQRL